jgi:hypothetical protein
VPMSAERKSQIEQKTGKEELLVNPPTAKDPLPRQPP